MIYKAYGFIHKNAKRILKKKSSIDTVKFVDYPDSLFSDKKAGNLNKSKVYPVENPVLTLNDSIAPRSFTAKRQKVINHCLSSSEAEGLWKRFLIKSEISKGYLGAGFHYAGYIEDCSSWCLPSWIWTNAALVRYYCKSHRYEEAGKLGRLFLDCQDSSGLWIVRNDYIDARVIRELAPNDSCYIALNACVPLYECTKDTRYLDAALRCADACIRTARPDGLVYISYDADLHEWIKQKNIVDIGFTAGLFARLYQITGKKEYYGFLKRFAGRYIDIFYMKDKGCFATAVDENDKAFGGSFGRGQAWALEGLIPAYEVLKDQETEKVIVSCIHTLLEKQKDGGWSYNLDKPLMGVDCKAVPVIARCFLEWNRLRPQKELVNAARSAMDWCIRHTVSSGEAAGGIFSYTIEGAVAHHMYTSTAFVYASAYALEVMDELEDLKE
jgi:rhamnogalacturonyl hydrolase YesR